MANTRVGVLVSGGGTDLQSIIDAVEKGQLKEVDLACVISSKRDAYALERAERHGIQAYGVTKQEYPDSQERNEAIMAILAKEQVDLVVLAGYLSILPKEAVQSYKGRLINIHPALLPKYGGKNFYGIHVHEAVLVAGEKESGATVHYVDEGVDTGEIILQEKVPVLAEDTPETLQQRVLEVEHIILPKAVGMVAAKLQERS